jgi:hypothetical protein
MSKTHVLIDFFHSRSPGYFDSTPLGSNATLVHPQKRSVNHFSVCTLEDGDNRAEKISAGIKQAHKDAQEFMVEEYGDDWKQSASYGFGSLNFYQEGELSPRELSYLDS